MNMNYSENPENFLQAVLEGFVDGVLVLTEQQEIVYANATAHSICSQLQTNPSHSLPEEVKQICQTLIESRELYPDHPVTLEAEVSTSVATLRIRAQWLRLEISERPCILLRLQNQNQFVQGLALAEAQRWGLTPRETEVWLLRRSGCMRKEIATRLYIALDTVKKHLKNIQTKRQTVLDEEEWQAQAS